MKTKIILLFLILFGVSLFSTAQLTGNKFKLSMEQMGTFYLEFKDGIYELTNPMGDVAVKGNHEITENIIQFVDKERQMACPENQVGKYRFTLNNNELKMELIEDSCTGRPNMAAKSWQLIEK